MSGDAVLEAASEFARAALAHDASGHDWWHARRVAGLAALIAQRKGAEDFVCRLAGWVHDVADYKVSGDEEAGQDRVSSWLQAQDLEPRVVDAVMEIIGGMSFAGGGRPPMRTLEGKVVQDADRLDAIGAIGVARAFAFGGAHGRKLHDPRIPVRGQMSEEEYRSLAGTSFVHFHEKLLLLSDKLNTKTAQQMARSRHRFLEQFLEQFQAEWREACRDEPAGPPTWGDA